MSVITEYEVLACENLPPLIVSVNEWIADGWQPSGTIIVAPEGRAFMQAMVKIDHSQENQIADDIHHIRHNMKDLT